MILLIISLKKKPSKDILLVLLQKCKLFPLRGALAHTAYILFADKLPKLPFKFIDLLFVYLLG